MYPFTEQNREKERTEISLVSVKRLNFESDQNLKKNMNFPPGLKMAAMLVEVTPALPDVCYLQPPYDRSGH